MPDKKEALRDAKTASNPRVGFGYNDLLAELAKEAMPVIDPVNEVTAPMYSKAFGISMNSAARILKKMVEEGKMVSRKVRLVNGHVCEAYRKAG